MAIGDLYRIVWHTTLNAKEIQNRWYYQQTDGNGNVFNLQLEFTSHVLNTLLAQLNDSLVNVRLDIENIHDTTDFATFPLTGNGAQVGDALPSHDAFNVTLLRGDKAFGQGRKSLAGVSEADQNNGVIDPARFLDLSNAFDVMDDVLNDGGGNLWTPVIARPPSSEGGNWQWTPIIGTILQGIGTMNTRK